MKKILIISFLLLVINCSISFAQTVENNQEFDSDESNFIIDTNDNVIIIRFDSNLPENGVNSISFDRIKTEEEFIFQTFIMDKLLKSNRILY